MRLGVLNKCPSSYISDSDRIRNYIKNEPRSSNQNPSPNNQNPFPLYITTTTTTTTTRTISDQIALRERDTQIGSTRVVKKKRGGFTPPQFPALLS
jgi:hypothetical protein